MRRLTDYLIEAEDYVTKPATGDVFEIEIARDEMLISGYITETVEDGIVIELDDRGVELLEGYGYVGERMPRTDLERAADRLSRKEFIDKYGKEHASVWDKMFKAAGGDQDLNEDLTADQEGTQISPDLEEAEYRGREVKLGKPMKGDVKKSKVYVRGPKGNVVKVNFGDPNMKIKKSNPKRRKSFRARHNCDNPGPRWKARYWSCRAW